ncbi:SANT/Myb_domain [Hexamita inflata]|uniref:SANT/Myb domain n=1 Tax=Hexamita inflata TaxID=28002 RepID=A0AA86Q3N7_9EUKA|nr:SANT/Myb domain [Hexamita inflata]
MPYKCWTEQELKEFVRLQEIFQQNFDEIAKRLNKTTSQVRSHYYYNMKLAKRNPEKIKQVIQNVLKCDSEPSECSQSNSSDENFLKISSLVAKKAESVECHYSLIIFDNFE